MWIVILWLVLCALVGQLAHSNGRSGVLFFFLSLFLSPLIGLIAALVAGRSEAATAARIEAEERLRADARERIEQERAAAKAPPAQEPPRASRGKAPRDWRAGED